jgi:hypothetical protein
MVKLYTQSEVAKMLRVSDRTMDNYRKQGLRFVRLGIGQTSKVLYLEEDVLAFITNHTQREETGKVPAIRKEWKVD